jgi:SAM-dependent methyltransferase
MLAAAHADVAAAGRFGRFGRLVLLPAVRALLAQLAAAVVAVAFAAGSARAGSIGLHPILLHAVLAAGFGQALRLPLWWVPINALFVPLVFWVHKLALHPAWFLATFAVLLGVFWTTYRTRVPLYLSSRQTCERLASLLPVKGEVRLLDLGCGLGGVLLALHRLRPNLRLTGREIAPVPAWIARLRLRRVPFADVRRADFWREDLSRYDVVYAFLSPQPMSELA